jgi:membrane fusion protein, copper/silver efflux system
MKRRTLSLVIGIVAVIAFGAGSLVSRPGGKVTRGGGRTILYYVDPMHPAYKSDKPGIAPDCGMQLEPVYADGGSSGQTGATLPPGAVQINQERQQLIGVRTAVVEKAPVSYQVRVLGRVVPDETRVYRINSSLSGFVKSVSNVTTGTFVKRDQYLASIYSPELYALINSYIFSLNAIDRQNKLTPENINLFRKDVNVRSNRNSLINIGMSETQLEEVLRERYNKEVIDIRSTEAGYILARNISLGERFERGVEFYRIADLSQVWVMADIFENEASYFTPGVRCTVRLPQRNLNFTGRMASVLPLYDPVTRTLKVRLETVNTGMVLRPEMFVDVELPVTLPAAITIPREALLDSGLKQTVFVDRGNGIFEPRPVEAGRHFGDRVEIVKGLVAGEKIVISGNFLMDSESRLKNTAAGINGTPGKDPVCGMALDQDQARAAGLTRQFAGKTYYFCGPEDRATFDKAPQRYTGPGAKSEPMSMGSGTMSQPSPQTMLPPVSGSMGTTMKSPAGGATRKQTPQPTAGRKGMNTMTPLKSDSGEHRNFPALLDEPGQKAGAEAMEEEVPPAPPATTYREVPSLNSIKMPPLKVTPGAAAPVKEVPSLNSIKVPPPHDK